MRAWKVSQHFSKHIAIIVDSHLQAAKPETRNNFPKYSRCNYTVFLFNLGFRLNDVLLQTRKVSSKLECVVSCVHDPCCRSVNYKDKPECAEESECELLHNTVYNTSRELKRNFSYDHISLDKPVKVYCS